MIFVRSVQPDQKNKNHNIISNFWKSAPLKIAAAFESFSIFLRYFPHSHLASVDSQYQRHFSAPADFNRQPFYCRRENRKPQKSGLKIDSNEFITEAHDKRSVFVSECLMDSRVCLPQ